METLRRGQRISPYRLEFLAALERTEAYAHTGNAKVLSNAVMKPLFITRGLLEHGMPTIKKAIYTMHFQDISPFTIQESIWPLNRTKNGPAICSKRMHILTYGETNFMVSSYNINTRIFLPRIVLLRSAGLYSCLGHILPRIVMLRSAGSYSCLGHILPRIVPLRSAGSYSCLAHILPCIVTLRSAGYILPRIVSL